MDIKLPEGFEEKIKELINNEWDEFKYSYDNNKYQCIRFNPNKVNKENYNDICAQLGVSSDAVPWEVNGRYYGNESHPGKHPFHEMGLYYIQEPSAMSAAALLAPKPGMKVLDLCAAPGGKSTQLAAFLNGQGLLISNEIVQSRSRILSSNIERLGIKNAIVTNEDSFRLAEKFPAFFHAILVDAPCSGEGMFRKNPEAMNEWSPGQVLVCANRQREILDNAAMMLMPGGCLVYSTCTFSKEENEETIEYFLDKNKDFFLESRNAPWFEKAKLDEDGAYRLWPHKIKGEGHFVAVLRKTGILNDLDLPSAGKKKNKKSLSKDKQALLEEFCLATFNRPVGDVFDEERFMEFGEQLYMLPENCPSLSGIHVLRAGLNIGEFKKNRFEPAHALALAVKKDDVSTYINLGIEDKRAFDFFEGQSFFVADGDEIKGNKGWCLICVNGYSAGWGKMAGGQIKNHYPKGLRKDLK